MPKELLPITRFGLGMVTSIDPQDVPLESAIYSENLDNNALGRLRGILANSLKSSTIGENAIGINNWLRRESGEYDLIYTDGTDVRSIQDFYGTPSEVQKIASKVPTSMVRMNRGMHIGTGSDIDTPPQFVGEMTASPFGGIGQIVFSGTQDDLSAKGFYTGDADATYYVEIDGTGTDTFRWNKDGGAWTSTVPITASWYQLGTEGIYIFINSASGHAQDETWAIPVKKPSVQEYNGNAELLTYDEALTVTPVDGNFSVYVSGGAGTVLRRYKFSLIYDGIQESLLSTENYDQLVADETTPVNGVITAGGASSLAINKRVTGFNLYQATSPTGDEADLGQFKLVNSYLIGNGDEWTSSSSDNKSISFTDDGITSVSYEQNSGILENADTNLPNYELGCDLNNSHFIAKCYVENFPDAKMMLFRSVEFCYDVFDIYNDKMYLNIVPTAIAGFNNKIYAWDNNTTVIINASSLSIETITHGTGCLSPLSWTIIDTLLDDKPYRALVWADSHDIYMDEGNGARPISDAIRTKINTSAVSWADMQHSLMNPILVFDAPKNTLLCITSADYANTKSSAFAYHITSKRWDYYPDFCNYSGSPTTDRLCKSAFSGKDGETYSVNGYQVLNNFGGAFNRAWKYYSPELIFGLPKQPKKFYNVYLDKVETSGAVTATYSIDKGATYRALTNDTEIKDVDDKWEKKNSIIVALSGTAGVNWVNAIELLHRRMVGVR